MVLEWEGAVKGVQFDRYGALWLGEVELLRTTTPEPSPDGIEWRIEGLDGLAKGNIGWCQDPYTTPSTITYAAKGDSEFHSPTWPESWFPDAFIGTMAQLLIAIENGEEPAIGARDNLKTMALVEAAYRSAEEHRAVGLSEIHK